MRWALVCVCALALGACETYEKDVASNSFFSGMEGADGPGVARKDLGRSHDPRQLSPDQQRVEDEDENVTLRARGPRHLMRHIFETLRDDERELFVEQVLSEATKQEFRRHGRDPEEAFDMLKAQLPDIDRLFARMPMAEHSPNAIYRGIGKNTHRLRLVQGAGRDLRWQGFDMIMEDGNERLLWFYEER